MSKGPYRGLVIVVCVAMVVLGGCGPTAEKALTGTEYIAQFCGAQKSEGNVKTYGDFRAAVKKMEVQVEAVHPPKSLLLYHESYRAGLDIIQEWLAEQKDVPDTQMIGLEAIGTSSAFASIIEAGANQLPEELKQKLEAGGCPTGADE